MARYDPAMPRHDDLHVVRFTRETDYPGLRKWLRYQGKGRFRVDHFICPKTFEPHSKFRFTDADTAFWAKMKFA